MGKQGIQRSRMLAVLLTAIALTAPAVSAQQAPRISGYAVDNCLHWGTSCGKPAADAYCQRTVGGAATSFQMGRMRPTLVQGDNRVCNQDNCVGFTEVTCSGSGGNPPNGQGGSPCNGTFRAGDGSVYRLNVIGNTVTGSYQAGPGPHSGLRGTVQGTVSGNTISARYVAQEGQATDAGTMNLTCGPGSNIVVSWRSARTASPPPVGTCDISGDWVHGGNGEKWTFTPAGNGTYRAQETGFANSFGAASLSGNRIHIDYSFGDRSGSGSYDVTLASGCKQGDGTFKDSRGNSGSVHFKRPGS